MPTPAAPHAPPAAPPWDDAFPAFIDYLASYRGYSPHTVKAYARDLREFRGFLAARHRSIESPDQVQRHMVVQYALRLRGAAPLTGLHRCETNRGLGRTGRQVPPAMQPTLDATARNAGSPAPRGAGA
jgi:hypothetical protein